MNEIGARLKYYLRQVNMSIKELSDNTGIPYNTVTRMVKGDIGMSSETLNKIFETFPTLNAEWLISGIGDIENLKNISKKTDENIRETLSIGSRLKKVLEARDVSYTEFALKSEIHYNSVTRMLTNDMAMNSKTLSKVFSIFPDLNPRYLITGEGEMFKNESENIEEVAEEKQEYIKNDDALLDAKLKAILTNPVMLDIIKEALKKYDESEI
nr:helix-turn-helix transcriptional regulator [uncultured Flavobacterium sp.]